MAQIRTPQKTYAAFSGDSDGEIAPICEDGELQDNETQSSTPFPEAMEEESLGIKSLSSWSRTSTVRARTSGMSIFHRCRPVPNRTNIGLPALTDTLVAIATRILQESNSLVPTP